jgi:DNA-binding MarR family transcriptional regulator
MAVAELGEVTTKTLADYADLSPATVVTVLENLEHREIVQRYRSVSDRRIVYTRLTPKGQQLMSHAPRVFGDEFARRFAGLSSDKRRELISSTSELADLMSPTSRPLQSPPGQTET